MLGDEMLRRVNATVYKNRCFRLIVACSLTHSGERSLADGHDLLRVVRFHGSS